MEETLIETPKQKRFSPRKFAENEIREHFEKIIKECDADSAFFDDLQNFIEVNEPSESIDERNHKSTHYFFLIKFYRAQYLIFKDNLYLGNYLIKLGREIEELNTFISSTLAPLAIDLLEQRNKTFEEIKDATSIGTAFTVFSELKKLEIQAYEKLSPINRTITKLSKMSVEFSKTEMA